MIRAIAIVAALLLVSCSDHDSHLREKLADDHKVPRKASEQLADDFPLLPLIESRKWKQLLAAETTMDRSDAPAEERTEAAAAIEKISLRLRQAHPFSSSKDRLVLGAVTYRKASREFEIPARVHFPATRDPRYPDELELVLCSDTGRTHETLFITNARPLHLELLMHLAGFTKSKPQSEFRVSVRIDDHTIIPVEGLIVAKGGGTLLEPMLWRFTGGDFHDLYAPDQTGDFLTCWSAHDSVLQTEDRGISSGETKLLAVPHPLLPQGKEVRLILTPMHESK